MKKRKKSTKLSSWKEKKLIWARKKKIVRPNRELVPIATVEEVNKNSKFEFDLENQYQRKN